MFQGPGTDGVFHPSAWTCRLEPALAATSWPGKGLALPRTARVSPARPSQAGSLGLVVGLPGPRPRRTKPRCSPSGGCRGDADQESPAVGRGTCWGTRVPRWPRPGAGQGPPLPRCRASGRERTRRASRPRVPGGGRGPGSRRRRLCSTAARHWPAPGRSESPKLPQAFSLGATRAVGGGGCYEQSPPCPDCLGESGANHRGSPAWVF